MARPVKLSGDLVAISVDGRGAAWCDGEFSGDQEIVEHARACALFSTEVDVMGIPIEADADSPTGALAALFAFSPGRSIIAQAPERLFDMLDDQARPYDEPWSA